MAKIERGRISGLHGMTSWSSVELFAWAAELEKQIQSPFNKDDPRWLQRWADKIKRLAVKKEKAKIHKKRQR